MTAALHTKHCDFCGKIFTRKKGDPIKFCSKECQTKARMHSKVLNKNYKAIQKDNKLKSKKLEDILVKQSQNGYISYGKYQVQLAKYEAEKKVIQREATSSEEYEKRIREAAKKYGI